MDAGSATDEERQRLAQDSAGYDHELPRPPSQGSSRSDFSDEGAPRRQRDSLYVISIFTVSLLVLVGALIAAAVGFSIARTGHFVEDVRKGLVEGYTAYPFGMQTIVMLLAVDLIWVAINLYLAFRGNHYKLRYFDWIWDFLAWGLLIAFGVLNTVQSLMYRAKCQGWEADRKGDLEWCEADEYRLLVAELVSVNMGMLVGVFHFIHMVGRAFTIRRDNMLGEAHELERYIDLGRQKIFRMREERDRLLAETEALLDTRRASEAPANESIEQSGRTEGRTSEDLIDVHAASVAEGEGDVPATH